MEMVRSITIKDWEAVMNGKKIRITVLRTAVLSVAFSLLATPALAAQPDKPDIVWTPKGVEETIVVGSSVELDVSFTATRDLAETTLKVVPELAPYVSVSPTALPALAKGTESIIVLTITVPQGTPPGILEGTVRVLEDKGTRARPLPVTLQVIQQIGPGGQTVVSPDGNATLVVSPNAVDETVTVTVSASSAPEFGDAALSVYDFGPDGTVFFAPAVLTVAYSESDIPTGVAETDLAIFYEAAPGLWVPLLTQVDTAANTAVAAVPHFTRFCLCSPAAAKKLGTQMDIVEPVSNFPANEAFFIRHGWELGSCSNGSSGEAKAQMADSGTRFDLYVNNVKQEPIEDFGCVAGVLVKNFLFSFPDGLTGTHILRGEFWKDGVGQVAYIRTVVFN